MNLNKDMYHLYPENYKALLRQVKEYINKWNDIPYSWGEGLHIVKVSILPKMICRLNIVTISRRLM